MPPMMLDYVDWDPQEQKEFNKLALKIFSLNPDKKIMCIKDLRAAWSDMHDGQYAGLKDCKDAIDRAEAGYSELATLVCDEDELKVLYEAVRIYLNTYGSAAMEGSDEMLTKLRDLRERQGWS